MLMLCNATRVFALLECVINYCFTNWFGVLQVPFGRFGFG